MTCDIINQTVHNIAFIDAHIIQVNYIIMAMIERILSMLTISNKAKTCCPDVKHNSEYNTL